MAEESNDGQEKTEDPTDERRTEFRERGDVAQSRELTSVFVMVAVISFMSLMSYYGFRVLKEILVKGFTSVEFLRLNPRNLIVYFKEVWIDLLFVVIPICSMAIIFAIAVTFGQTQMNFSWKKIAPNFNKLNPLEGIKRMFSTQALMELLKGIGKMAAVSIVTVLLLYSERHIVPALLNLSIIDITTYWASHTRTLFWSVAALLLIVAAADYLYNYTTLENKMKMTKQEVKEDYKKREVDPMVRNRMRRMQREAASRKSVKATEDATVLITNPTHYSVAIKYELGMGTPILIGKGVDFIALQMREVAKKHQVPIVENKPLARTIYKTMEIGEEIPQSLYKAISEVIRYVFKVKGVRINRNETQEKRT